MDEQREEKLLTIRFKNGEDCVAKIVELSNDGTITLKQMFKVHLAQQGVFLTPFSTVMESLDPESEGVPLSTVDILFLGNTLPEVAQLWHEATSPSAIHKPQQPQIII